MASQSKQPTAADTEYVERFPNWVYQVPGFVLMVGGFGGLALMTLV